MFNKRAVSPVIATVLLILITVVAASVIAVFVIPFVSNNLDNSKACFAVLGKMTLAESSYLCSASDSVNGDRTGFSVQFDSSEIDGFVVLAITKGASERIEVMNGTTDTRLKMLRDDETFGVSELIIPSEGGVRTYVYKGAADRIEVYPMLSGGKICDKGDEKEVNICTDTEIRDDLYT